MVLKNNRVLTRGADHHHDVGDNAHDQHHVHDDSHGDVHDAQEHRLSLK